MPLKQITTINSPRYRVSAGGFYAINDGTKVLKRGELAATLETSSKIIAADTEAEIDAEILRLNLTPLTKTPAQLAADYFSTLDPSIQQQFAAVFQAVSALSNVADKIVAIQGVKVPPELEIMKEQFINILNGKSQ